MGEHPNVLSFFGGIIGGALVAGGFILWIVRKVDV